MLCLLKSRVCGSQFLFDRENVSASEWENVFHLATVQGVAPVLMSEIERFPHEQLPPKGTLLKWYAQKNVCKNHYIRQEELSCEFADAMARKGLTCLVLKGLGAASYYPEPETRMFGDLDCFLIQGNKPASETGNKIAEKIGAKVEYASYKHTHIHYKGLLVENHKYLTNFNQTKQGAKIEKILQRLAVNGKWKRLGNSNLWMPSPEFNMLFLLKHSLGDFIANDMLLRSLYDWAAFLSVEHNNIDWKEMDALLECCKLKNFFNVMTEACMTYLGLELGNHGLSITSQGEMVDSLVNDVLNKPTIGCGQLPFKDKIPNIMSRFKRQWKYRAIETESYRVLVKNTIAYSSLFNRKVSLN